MQFGWRSVCDWLGFEIKRRGCNCAYKNKREKSKKSVVYGTPRAGLRGFGHHHARLQPHSSTLPAPSCFQNSRKSHWLGRRDVLHRQHPRSPSCHVSCPLHFQCSAHHFGPVRGMCSAPGSRRTSVPQQLSPLPTGVILLPSSPRLC